VIEYAKVLAPHVEVIASAGSAEKVKIMKNAGADVVFNYKEEDTFRALNEHGPIDL
jgi:NADPH-dependent curcumin reductase CurA